MDFLFGFSKDKLKPNLKMSVQRIIIKKQKGAAIAQKQKKEIASLLADGKEEKARIRTEAVIRSDFQIEAYEIIELMADLLAERMSLVCSEKRCPSDLRECVSTLIWCANRTEIPELKEVRNQLVKKYGSEFEKAAMQNLNGCVNERIIVKLNVKPPNAFLVNSYMREIAIANNVNWEPDPETDMNPMEAMPAPTGYTVQAGAMSQVPQPNFQLPPGQYVPPMAQPAAMFDPSLQKPPPHDGGYGLPQAPAEVHYAPMPGVSQAEIGGLPDVPPAGQMAQAQAYPMPPAVQQPPTQEIPQAPTFLPQAPPGSSSDNTSTGFDDLQARLDALKKK